MTCCLVMKLDNVVIAAADTRVNATTNLGVVINDGPEPFVVTTPKTQITVPFRFRKIRPIGDGWACSAGGYLLGRELLEDLAGRQAGNFQEAMHSLQLVPDRIRYWIEDIGLNRADLEKTVIFGANVRQSTGVWSLGPTKGSPMTIADAGSYVINFPDEIPVTTKAAIQKQFAADAEAAHGSSDPASLAKAVARVIDEADRLSKTVGPNIQIGISANRPDGSVQNRYLESETKGLLAMSPQELMRHFHPV